MKGCKHYEDLFVDGLYDELTEEERKSLQTHLENCPQCASIYRQMSESLQVMNKRQQPEMGDEYWDSYWVNLQDRMNQDPTPTPKSSLGRIHQFLLSLRSKWVLIPVAATLLLVVGIYLGRTFFSPNSPTPAVMLAANEPTADQSVQSALSQHLQDMRPMLVECSNISSQQLNEENNDVVAIDRATLKKLVVQNYLLKKMVSENGDPTLKKMLNELELILTLMSNRNGNSQQDLLSIKDIIKNQDLLFKTRIYSQKPLSKRI